MYISKKYFRSFLDVSVPGFFCTSLRLSISRRSWNLHKIQITFDKCHGYLIIIYNFNPNVFPHFCQRYYCWSRYWSFSLTAYLFARIIIKILYIYYQRIIFLSNFSIILRNVNCIMYLSPIDVCLRFRSSAIFRVFYWLFSRYTTKLVTIFPATNVCPKTTILIINKITLCALHLIFNTL